jgi:hypothetical protein
MTTKIQARIEEVKKGCGSWSEGKVKGLTVQMQCGNTGFKDKICLCEVCRDKLAAYEQCQKWEAERDKEEIEWLKEIFDVKQLVKDFRSIKVSQEEQTEIIKFIADYGQRMYKAGQDSGKIPIDKKFEDMPPYWKMGYEQGVKSVQSLSHKAIYEEGVRKGMKDKEDLMEASYQRGKESKENAFTYGKGYSDCRQEVIKLIDKFKKFNADSVDAENILDKLKSKIQEKT